MPAPISSGLPPELRTERGRWDRLARDPYYAVINDEAYRGTRLSDGEKDRFDRSGEADVARTLQDIRALIDPDFRPRHALDLGCGTGRLTIPLARVCTDVVGVDISEVMLSEAGRNATERDVTNVRFVATKQYFGDRGPSWPSPDFIHSYIVFQHIPPRAGMWITRSLFERLAPAGIGALHYTFARRASSLRRLAHLLRRTVPGVNMLANVVKDRRLLEPMIPMYEYDLAQIFALLAENHCEIVHVRLTDHGGHLGAMLYFRRG